MPQPFLLLIAANLAQAGFLGWKWSLWPMPAWLEVQESKAFVILTLYDSINDIQRFWNFFIAPQPCHSHFSCWLLPIWPKLDFWAENGAYCLCQLGWRYNGAKLSFSSPYMIVSFTSTAVQFNFQWVFRMQLIGGVGENQQSSWGCWIYLGRDLRKNLTKIEACAGMAERLVRDLEIEEALQE